MTALNTWKYKGQPPVVLCRPNSAAHEEYTQLEGRKDWNERSEIISRWTQKLE